MFKTYVLNDKFLNKKNILDYVFILTLFLKLLFVTILKFSKKFLLKKYKQTIINKEKKVL